MTNFEAGDSFAGRYKIIRRLGAGGMGAVYLACDPLEPEFLVALKVLNPGQAQNALSRERFRNEITASYKINHPHVVRAYEYFDAEDVQAYAMEFVDGGDLAVRIANGALGVPEVLTILKQSVEALTAIHAAGIIHRDLKPENMLLTKKGDVKITDFGVARLKDTRTLTNAGSMVGTAKYLAPEYIEMGECDARGDIFALGIIAYELLSGVAPYGEDPNPSKMLQRLSEPVIPLSEICRGLPVGLSSIVMKAMETRVSKRYQNANAFLEDLNLLAAGGVPLALTEAAAQESTPASAPVTAPSESPTPSTQPESFSDWGKLNNLGSAARPTIKNHALSERFIVAEPVIDDEPLLQSPWRKYIAAGMLAITVASAGVAYRVFRPSLVQLSEGNYVGSAVGLFGQDSQTPIGVIRSGDATVLVLGRAGCAPSKIEAVGGAFKCGDLAFEITIEAVTDSGAVGTITEKTWHTLGTWSLRKS